MKLLRHLHDLCKGEVALDLHADWPCLLVMAGIVALTGPLVFLACAIQDWCAGTSWDYEDRWRGTRAFAVTFLVVALLLVLVRGFFLQFWPPTLSALFWYPVFWWCLCLLFSPALALFMERLDPRTRPLERILLPAEVAQQQTVVASEKKMTRLKSTRTKQVTAQANEKDIVPPSPQQRKTKRDPRPIYEAWAVPQHILPPAPARGSMPSPSSKRDRRDEGESLADIF